MRNKVTFKISTLLLSAGIILGLMPEENSFAATIAESSAHIPWKFVEESINSKIENQNFSWQGEWTSLSQEIQGLNWKIKNLKLQTLVQAHPVSLSGSNGEIYLNSSQLQFYVESLEVNQIIEKVIQGMIVRVHVQAQCGPVLLKQNNFWAKSKFSFFVKNKSEMDLNVQLSEINWPEGSWEISEFKCSGLSGLDESIKSELVNALRNSKNFLPQLNQFLNDHVKQDLLNDVKNFINSFTFKIPDLGLQMQIDDIFTTQSGWGMDFKIQDATEENPQSSSVKKNIWTEEMMAKLPGDKPAQWLSQDGLQNLLQYFLRKKSYLEYQLNQNKSFHDLLRSRFIQFFLWPDLFNFPKSSIFTLRMTLPLEFDFNLDGKNGIVAPLNVSAVVFAPRDNQIWPYVQMQGSGVLRGQFQVMNDQLQFRNQLEVVRFNSSYGDDYVQQFGDPGYLPKSTLKKVLKQMDSLISFSLPLPKFEIPNWDKYSAKNLYWLDNKFLMIEWSPQ